MPRWRIGIFAYAQARSWPILADRAEVGYHRLMSKLTGVRVERPEQQRNYGFGTAYLVGWFTELAP